MIENPNLIRGLNMAPKKRDPDTERLKAEFLASRGATLCPGPGEGQKSNHSTNAWVRNRKAKAPTKPKQPRVQLSDEERRHRQRERNRRAGIKSRARAKGMTADEYLKAMESNPISRGARKAHARARGEDVGVQAVQQAREIVNEIRSVATSAYRQEIADRNAKVVETYLSGASLDACAEIYGISVGSVRHALKNANVKPRPWGHRAKPAAPSDYVIETGIPIPPRAYNYGDKKKYPLGELEINQSFFVPGLSENIRSAVANYAKNHPGKTFTSRFMDGGVRVWRTS
ncbi:hypothetical protein [Methylobacterium sp. 1030]|uniref:hypothetical protein n=1 Tax=Methylobacterium sp. 1030 TaxID=3156404 RepID=UPI003392D8CB